MRIFFLGDIVGRSGREAVKNKLPELIKKYSPDVIIANGENSAAGYGLTKEIALDLFSASTRCACCKADVCYECNEVLAEPSKLLIAADHAPA